MTQYLRHHLLLLLLTGYLSACTSNPDNSLAKTDTLNPTPGSGDKQEKDNNNSGEPVIAFEPKFSFKDFNVDSVYNGHLKPINYSGNTTAKKFKTKITDAYAAGINFGGHYTFAYWGCGSPCQQSAIVDALTGKVYDGPYASLGYEYHNNSLMVLVNPPNDTSIYHHKIGYYLADCPYCVPEIWTWDENAKKFKQVQ